MQIQKSCSKCGTVQPLKNYQHQMNNLDARSNTCNDCLSEYNKQRKKAKEAARACQIRYF